MSPLPLEKHPYNKRPTKLQQNPNTVFMITYIVPDTPIPLPNGSKQEVVFLRRLDIALVRSNVNRYVVQFNKDAATTKDKIRGGAFATLLRVCDEYVRRNTFLATKIENPIPCRMNNVRLGHLVKLDKRSIQNHLNKLEQLGIVHKTFRGTKADYELTVCPKVLLFGTEQQNTNTTLAGSNDTPTATEKEDKAKNLRQSSLVHLLEKSNIQPKGCELVDNCITEEKNSGQAPSSLGDSTTLGHFSCTPTKASSFGVKSPTLSTTPKEKNKLGGGGAKISGGAGGESSFPKWQLAMVISFYRYAMGELYPYHQFDKEMERKTLNKLFNHVYGGFKNTALSRKDWEKYHATLIERVNLVKAWKERPLEGIKSQQYQDGKFIVNPLTFFDRDCKYGFIQTEQWLVLQYKRKQLIKAELELEKARKEILSDTDRLRVYHKWETRFKNKKLPEIMPLFYSAMADMQKRILETRNTLVN